MAVNRRVVLSGLALPALAGIAVPQSAQALPGIPVPGLPELTDATHDATLTTAVATALAAANIAVDAAKPAVAVPQESLPSWRLKLSVGTVSLDLLHGVVAFDGGFRLTGNAESTRSIEFDSFTSDLAAGKATALFSVDGQAQQRIEVFTFDLTHAGIEAAAPNLKLSQYPLVLTTAASDAIKSVFPQAPVCANEPFAIGAATGTYVLPV